MQSKQVSAQVPQLSETELGALVTALRAAVETTMRPISAREAEHLPLEIKNVYEGFAYAENATCRIINSLKLLPDFRSIPLALQMSILKVLLYISSLSSLLIFSYHLISSHLISQMCLLGVPFSHDSSRRFVF